MATKPPTRPVPKPTPPRPPPPPQPRRPSPGNGERIHSHVEPTKPWPR